MRLRKLFLSFLLFPAISFSLNAQVVRGYFPYYRTVADANAVNYTQLTDVIYAFASVDASGNISIMGSSVFDAVRTNCASNSVKLWVALGGAGLSGNFSSLAASSAARTNLANNCLTLCTTYNLAGIDIDWEFPGSGDKTNFTSMLSAIKSKLGSTYKLSAALGGDSFSDGCVASGHTPGVESAAFTYLDYVNIMTYDASPSCFSNHTAVSYMEKSMDGWNALGCPYSKMLPGIAFYGKCASIQMYKDLSASDPSGYFNDSDGIYGGYCYDSKPTIQAKVNYAMCTKGAPGMMIWELSQDRSDAYALLPAVKSAVDACGCDLSTFSLGSDVSLCGVGSVTLIPSPAISTASGRTFTWKKDGVTLVSNSTATTYNATSAGTYDLTVSDSKCSKSDEIVVTSTLPAPDLSGATTNICDPASLTFTPSNLSGFPSGTTWQWSYNGSDLTGETSSTLSDIRKSGTYSLKASVSGCASTNTSIAVTSSLPTPVDGCTNSAGTVNLSITNTSSGPYYWYSSSLGGSSLHTGTSYTTPSISSTTTYYVQVGAGVSGSVGGTGAFGAADWSGTITNKKLSFTTTVAGVQINSVDIYVQEWASVSNLIVTIETSGGTVIGSTSAPVSYDNSSSGSPYKLTINTSSIPSLSAAGSYNIYFSGSSSGTPRYTSSGFPYTESTSTISLTGGTMYFNNIQFVGGSACKRLPVIANVGGCGSLPVVFNDIELTNYNGSVLIEWSTSQERNNNYFEVQCSGDGNLFETLGSVKGEGNSKKERDYSYLDTRNLSGSQFLYYRIKQVDIDGSVSYSDVKVWKKKNVVFVVGPNPFESNSKIISSENLFELKVYNAQGEMILETESLTNEFTLGEGWKAGVYFIHLQSGNDVVVKRIVKIK